MHSVVRDQALSKVQSHQQRREASFNLLLASVLLVAVAGIVGFVFALIFGSEDAVREIAAGSLLVQAALASMPILVVAGTIYCIRKTREITGSGILGRLSLCYITNPSSRRLRLLGPV